MELRTFLYSQAIVSFAVLLSDVCNFVFYSLALQFPAEQFAEVAAVTALNFIVVVVASTMGTYLIMRTKEGSSQDDAEREGLRLSMTVSLTIALLFAIASPLLAGFFHFSASLPFVILGVTVIPTTLTSVLQSVLLTRRKFWLLAVSIAAYGFGRIPAGYLLFSDGYAATDTPLALGLAACVTLCITAMAAGSVFRLKNLVPLLPNADAVRSLLQLLWSLFIVGALLKIDILWAKHGLSGADAGVYGITSLVASVLYYLTNGVGKASSAYLTKENVRRVATMSGIIILVACAACVAGYFIIGAAIFARISDHADDIRTVPLLLLFAAMTGYSLLGFTMQCLGILHRSVHVRLMTGVVIIDAILLVTCDGSMERIATIQAMVLITGALIGGFLLLHHTKKQVA